MKIICLLFLIIVPCSAAFDSYGGRTDLPCIGGIATRFYSERIGSQWWLCTPSGNAMFAQGTYITSPQGDYNAKYGSESVAFEQTIIRMRSWGFNFVHANSDSRMLAWNRTNKIPGAFLVKPGYYGMVNGLPSGTVSHPIKDLHNSSSPYMTGQFIPTGHVPDFGDLVPMGEALTYLLTANGSGDPAGTTWPIAHGGTGLDYLIGVAVEDSDQTWGFWSSGSNDPYDTQPFGKGAIHGGYWTATMSPIQQADASTGSVYTIDPIVHVKKEWHDFLVTKYGTVSMLNTAWGSTYTTVDSSASQITAEAFVTTNGTSGSFTHTLENTGAVVPGSIQIYAGGAMIAGDCFKPQLGGACNPGAALTSGGVWGPTVPGGDVNYSTKSVTVAYSGAKAIIDSITCSVSGTPSCMAVFADWSSATLASDIGDHVVITGSTCCASANETITGKTGPSGGLFTYTWTNTANRSGTETYAGNFKNNYAAKLTIPTAGTVLTVSYQVNGWDAGGTGLMDEDGRPSHSWMGTNPMSNGMSSDPYTLGTLNANTAADMRAFLYQLAHGYFGAMRTGVRAAFVNAGFDPPMYLGPDSLGTWTGVPRKEVLQAASDTIDVAIFGGAAGYVLTQPMLDFVAQWYGRGFIDGVFLHANADSPYSANMLEFDYATQPARAAAYLSTITSYLSNLTTSGFNPRLGFGWWQYGDNSSESTNWGLVTLKDNAYDSHETVTGLVACSAPLAAYTCGGETGNYGDMITSVKATNALWTAVEAPGASTVVLSDSSNSRKRSFSASPPSGLVMRVYFSSVIGGLISSTTYCQQDDGILCWQSGTLQESASLNLSGIAYYDVRYYDVYGNLVSQGLPTLLP